MPDEVQGLLSCYNDLGNTSPACHRRQGAGVCVWGKGASLPCSVISQQTNFGASSLRLTSSGSAQLCPPSGLSLLCFPGQAQGLLSCLHLGQLTHPSPLRTNGGERRSLPLEAITSRQEAGPALSQSHPQDPLTCILKPPHSGPALLYCPGEEQGLLSYSHEPRPGLLLL